MKIFFTMLSAVLAAGITFAAPADNAFNAGVAGADTTGWDDKSITAPAAFTASYMSAEDKCNTLFTFQRDENDDVYDVAVYGFDDKAKSQSGKLLTPMIEPGPNNPISVVSPNAGGNKGLFSFGSSSPNRVLTPFQASRCDDAQSRELYTNFYMTATNKNTKKVYRFPSFKLGNQKDFIPQGAISFVTTRLIAGTRKVELKWTYGKTGDKGIAAYSIMYGVKSSKTYFSTFVKMQTTTISNPISYTIDLPKELYGQRGVVTVCPISYLGISSAPDTCPEALLPTGSK